MFPVRQAAAPKRGRDALEELLVSNLSLLNSIVGIVARRQRLSTDEADDFSSWATLRIVADDFAVLAKFRGESALSTYLMSVVTSLLRDYRHAVDGRWRSSAAALRIGELGVRLERLLIRDEMPLQQAGELLRTAGATTLPDRELAAIASSFPRRDPLRPIQYLGDVETCLEVRNQAIAPEPDDVDDEADRKNLVRALASLTSDEQKLVELVFWKHVSIADAARKLGVPQKPLYRRLDRILRQLREVIQPANEARARVRNRRAVSLR